MKKPRFYVGQSVVIQSGEKGEMYAISHASFENGNWIYYAVQGSETRYIQDYQVVFYHDNGEWHEHNAS